MLQASSTNMQFNFFENVKPNQVIIFNQNRSIKEMNISDTFNELSH